LEYEKLKKQKFINCQYCNSLEVEKNLMAPSVFKSKDNVGKYIKDKKYKEIKKTILEHQKFIENNFDYVGENFAYEARSMHYDNKKSSKAIYGSASKDDIKELNEEGIETEIIPWIKNVIN
jgi:hypothetical protein|tara:strand:+ start:452 stop:814 length:363 start_codon:yes stop_codon:yes gene_type:complete